jgi:hypothetical protein
VLVQKSAIAWSSDVGRVTIQIRPVEGEVMEAISAPPSLGEATPG